MVPGGVVEIEPGSVVAVGGLEVPPVVPSVTGGAPAVVVLSVGVGCPSVPGCASGALLPYLVGGSIVNFSSGLHPTKTAEAASKKTKVWPGVGRITMAYST